MDTIQKAKALLGSVEAELRILMDNALKEQQYRDVAEVAKLADGIAKLRRGQTATTAVASRLKHSQRRDSANALVESSKVKSPATAKSLDTKGQYPRFRRDRDRLVKVGWSKKTRKEYEHRAPREAVVAFIQHLVSNVSEGEVFDVEGLLPVLNSSGEEVPAYQVYLTLAWLRDAEVIKKRGRDGYVLRNGSLLDGELEQLWNSVPLGAV